MKKTARQTLIAAFCAAMTVLPVVAKESTAKESTSKTGTETQEKANDDISLEEAYYIGRAVAGSVFGKYKRYKNNSLDVYLNKICMALVVNSDDPVLYNGYHVAVLDSDELNAFSTPGGHILITKGLVKCSNSEDSLAAVLAHEIAHIQLGHPINAIKKSRTMASFSKKVKSLSSAISSGYSKQNEFDADSAAIRLMADAGYSPRALLDMLNLLAQNTKKTEGFGKTHPSPKTRSTMIRPTVFVYTNSTTEEDTSAARQSRYDAVMKTVK